jgi:C-terminal processing protease CtpA/Prc
MNAQRFSHVAGAVKTIILTQSVQCSYDQTGGRIYVCEIIPGSPADESREVQVGDILLSVDGQRVQGMQLESVNRLIAGTVGSSVTVEFQHEDGSTSRTSSTLCKRIRGKSIRDRMTQNPMSILVHTYSSPFCSFKAFSLNSVTRTHLDKII